MIGMNYALVNIKTGIVESVIVWDGESEWAPPDGLQAIQSEIAGIGWLYAAGEFTAPPPPAPPPLTQPEIIAANKAARDDYLRRAALEIAPLQDAVDLDIATDREKASLGAWKKYRVDVSRIDVSVLNPTWPTKPN